MPSSPFPRTARSLARESSVGARLLLVSAVALLGGWGAWFVGARVPVYETSQSARLEVLRATHPVDAAVAGRVIEVRLLLDDVVKEGDVIARLDASAQELQLQETRAKIAGIAPQLEAIRAEARAEQRALAAYRGQLDADLAEAQSRVKEAEILTRAGQNEADRAERLRPSGVVSEAEYVRAKAEAERRVASEAAVRAQLEKLRRESATGAEDRVRRVATLDREAAGLEADLATLEAQVPALEHEIELRVIRAPAEGKIGEIANVRVGSVLAQGEHVATVVASGDLRVVASFAPATAFGKVHPGQSARVRLDGFPWTEYGALRATVTDVATELHDGQARIELTVDRSSATRIPLQHGLPGSVDVAVEETSPASLVLRAAGRLGS